MNIVSLPFHQKVSVNICKFVNYFRTLLLFKLLINLELLFRLIKVIYWESISWDVFERKIGTIYAHVSLWENEWVKGGKRIMEHSLFLCSYFWELDVFHDFVSKVGEYEPVYVMERFIVNNVMFNLKLHWVQDFTCILKHIISNAWRLLCPGVDMCRVMEEFPIASKMKEGQKKADALMEVSWILLGLEAQRTFFGYLGVSSDIEHWIAWYWSQNGSTLFLIGISLWFSHWLWQM